jgi:class 3 adenylate cyclase
VTCLNCGAELPAGARFCPACGAPASTAPTERRLVTALFCDLVGSTRLAEQVDAEVLSAVMTEYRGLFRRAVERNGGTVVSFTGDGAVALFGVPSAHEDDALQAARAGLDLLEELPNTGEAAAHGIVLQARVGIEAGELLGDTSQIASNTLAADVLNTAARLQSAAEPGTVLAGPEATQLVEGRAEVRAKEPIVLKGKAAPVSASVVVSASGGSRRMSTSTFVGRERHLASLERALGDAVEDAAPVLTTVLGDAGIGKSRLLDAFLTRRSDATILRASVPALGEGASLAPLADLVRTATGAADTALAADRLEPLLADRHDAAALETALRSLLGVGEGSTGDHAWALRRLLETLAARGPVIAAIDDLHWASPALIDLVEDAARWTRGPVLLLCGARPDLLDVRRSWGGGMQRSLTMTLGPLDTSESRSLADELVGARESVTDRLVETAEGNPLFLEQLAAEAQLQGDAWNPSEMPTSVRALLEARLDRASKDLAQMLGVASVQGSRFRFGLVQSLLNDDVDVHEMLREAQLAHLAEEIDAETGAFAHALVRESAYRRLPKETRAELHAALGQLLSDDEELAGVHLERAAAYRAELGHRDLELERRAGERLARTGAAAFARLDLVTSSDYLSRAARLLPSESPSRLALLPDLAVALMENGRSDDAQELLAGAVEEAEGAGSRRDASRIRLQQLAVDVVYRGVSKTEITERVGEARRLLDELTSLGDDVGLAQGGVVLEYLHWLLGDMRKAEEASMRSVEHAARAGRLREQVQAGGDHAMNLVLGPWSVPEMREIAERRRRSPNAVVAAGADSVLAATAALSGDRVGYLEAEGRWRAAWETGGLEWPSADQAMLTFAPALLEAGDPARAERLAREGLDTMERLGDIWMLNGPPFWISVAIARQGRADEAALYADKLDNDYRWMGTPDHIARGIAVSTALASRGKRDEALRLAGEAAEDARSTDSNLLRSLALEHLAGLLEPVDAATAIETLEEVAEIDDASGNDVGAARIAGKLERLQAPPTS